LLTAVALGLASFGFCAPLPARADEAGLAISDAWMRFIIAARPAAGYFTLANSGDHQTTLVAAASPACGSMMLHRSRSENGVDTMAPIASVAVPTKGSVTFAPGGYHIMCMKPGDEMRAGSSVPVTLTFGDGGTLSADFMVRGATGK